MKNQFTFLKSLFATLAMAIILLAPSVSWGQTITIGTGTTYYTGTTAAPFTRNYNYGWSKFIYLKSEINTLGDIIAIALENNVGSVTSWTTQSIYMRHTSATTEVVARPTAAELLTSWTKVYDASTIDYNTAYKTITLSRAFSYNNTDNLEIYYLNYQGTNSTNGPQFRYSGTTNRTVAYRNDSKTTFDANANAGATIAQYPNIKLTFSTSACSGTPAPGNTISTTNPACIATNFTLSLQNATTGTGVTYQWQSSSDGSSWGDIVGATSATCVTNQSSATYYHCLVTCAGNIGTSNSLLVNMNSFLNCYCSTIPGTINATDIIVNTKLTNSVGGIYQNPSTSNGTTNYDIYNNTPLDLTPGSITNKLDITVGTDGTQASAAWIDFNRNGVYEASENIALSVALAGSSAVVSYTFTVPLGASLGNTRMRVRAGADVVANYTAAGACTTSPFGETEDYLVNIITPPLTPPSLTADITDNNVDNNIDITFTDDATWRGLITAVKIGGTALTLTTDYVITAGNIQLKPSGGNALLTVSGSKAVTVEATGYTTASVTQQINFGAAIKLGITRQPTAPASNGVALAQQPIVTVQDQYGNTVTNSSASITAAAVQGTWTLGGTSPVTAISGITTFNGLTATCISAVTGATILFSSSGLTSVTSSTFNIPVLMPQPSVPTNLTFATITCNSYNASFTAPVTAPTGYLVLRRPTSAVTGTPVAGTEYTLGQTNIGSGINQVVYVGTSAWNNYSQSALTDNTAYYYAVYSYNGSSVSTNYSTALTGNQTTASTTAPVATSASIVLSGGFTANWNASTCATSYKLDVATNINFNTNATIASEGFENATPLFTTRSGGAFYSGNSGSGDLPATSPFAIAGTYSYGISSGTAILTSSDINTSSYTSNQLSFRLASFSVNSAGNGADATDIVTVEISPNGGTNYYSTVRVLGSTNAAWSYSGGTANASTSYDGNATPIDFQPAAGGSRTTDGYSTVTVTGLPISSNLRIRITLLNDNANERWLIDDLNITGSLSSCLAGYDNLTVNSTSQAVSGLTSGTNYYYRVRAVGGNSTSGNSNTITVTTAVNVATSVNTFNNVYCNAGSNGSVTLNTATGGSGSGYMYAMRTPPTSGTWGSWQSGTTFSGLTAATYEFKAKDGVGTESSTVTQAISQPISSLSIGVTPTSPLCHNGATGQIIVTASGGNSPYTFSKEVVPSYLSGSSPYTFDNLTTGNYTISVKDANLCVKNYGIVTLTNPSDITISSIDTSYSSVSCYGGNDGWIRLHASGGTGTLQYSKDNGAHYQSSNTFNDLIAGNYNIIVKDANNCTSAYVGNPIVITQYDIMSATVTSTNTCNGLDNGTITFSAENGGTGEYNYSIDGGSSWQASGSYTGLAVGTYYLELQDLNYSSCTRSIGSVTLTQPTIANAGTDQSLTGTWEVTLAANVPSAGTGTWTKRSGAGNASFDPNTNTNNAKAIVDAYDTYTFRWTIVSGTCTTYDEVDVTFGASETSTFSNTGNWNNYQKWDNGVPTNSTNAIINGDVTVTANAECAKLIINAGKSLTLNLGITLNVNDSLVLKSDGTSGNAALIDKGTITYNSTKTLVQLYVRGNSTRDTMFHYFSSPVNASSINVFRYFYMYHYNEATNSWVNNHSDEFMTNALGYAGFYTGVISSNPHITIKFNGTFNTGNKTANLTRSNYSQSVPDDNNFNLIGNPYPSPIDLDSITLNNVDPIIYFWNGTGSNAGNYATYNISSKIGALGGQHILPAGQGILVHANGANPSIGFTNNDRITGTQALYKATTIHPNQLRLSVQGNEFRDEAVVGFIQGATQELDGMFDAYKLSSNYDLVPKLYTLASNGSKLAINEYPLLEQGQAVVIPVEFTLGANGLFNLTASEVNTFDNDISLFLEDLSTQEMVNLRNINTYNFNFLAGDIAHRFNLHFKREANTTGIDELATNIDAYSFNNSIYISSNDIIDGKVFVYNVLGQEIVKTQIEGKSTYRINANALSKGYYLVKVISSNKSITKKVYID